MDELLEDIRRRVPELRDPHAAVTLLTGGLTNRNYRVDTSAGSFVVRIPGADGEQLDISRIDEHACSRAAAAIGVGADVVAFVPEHQALVTRFVVGRVLEPGDSRQPELLGRIARQLHRLHEQQPPPKVGVFSAFEVVRVYHARARKWHVEFPKSIDQALERLARVEELLATDAPLCLCHNDLLPGNFIDEERSMTIIDWEYAGGGDRFFDLGNFAVNHRLDEPAERRLLSAYFGVYRADDHRRLRLMRLASDMREAFWGFLQAGISRLDFDYQAYARQHLERFLAEYDANPIAGPLGG